MAFTLLKKWVETQLWSDFMIHYNTNIDALNDVILDTLARVNSMYQYGTAEISTTAGTTVSQTITFSPAFTSTPMVQLTMGGTVPQRFNYSAQNITTTGFDIYLRDTSTGTGYVRWLAIL